MNGPRKAIERAIAKAAIAGLLATGSAVWVNNGEEDVLDGSRDADAILKAMFTTDEDWLLLGDARPVLRWVRFVYGNDGTDVISDYSVTLEEALKPASVLADAIDKGAFDVVPR